MANVIETVTGWIGGHFDPVAEEAARLVAEARARATEIPLEALERRGPLLVDTRDSSLWTVSLGSDPSRRVVDPSRHFAIEGDPPTPRWLDPGVPRTLAELEAAEAAQQAANAKYQAAEKRRLAAAPRRAISLSDLERRRMPTLAEAASTIRRYGDLRIVDRHLIVDLAAVDTHALPTLLDSARVLYAAASFVAGELAAGRDLPDCQVTPNGWPIP